KELSASPDLLDADTPSRFKLWCQWQPADRPNEVRAALRIIQIAIMQPAIELSQLAQALTFAEIRRHALGPGQGCFAGGWPEGAPMQTLLKPIPGTNHRVERADGSGQPEPGEQADKQADHCGHDQRQCRAGEVGQAHEMEHA